MQPLLCFSCQCKACACLRPLIHMKRDCSPFLLLAFRIWCYLKTESWPNLYVICCKWILASGQSQRKPCGTLSFLFISGIVDRFIC